MADLKDNLGHLAILLGLIISLLVVLLFTGIVSCGDIPGSCEIYYQVLRGGQPQVLVAYSESSGMGSPEALAAVLSDRGILNARVKAMDMQRLTMGNVTEYELVIVEGARKICTEKLRVFMYFVNSGGKLVWTGDAGTELCEGDEYLKDKERNEGGEDKIIGPWARKDGDKQVNFDQFLGVDYIGNRCALTQCRQGELAGMIEPVTLDHKLVYGLSPAVPFKGDFAVVQLNNETNTRLVAALDYGTSIVTEKTNYPWLESGKRYSFGQKLPFIVSSQIGGRVAYYAAPVESFVSTEQPQPYKALVEQMYYGMLYK